MYASAIRLSARFAKDMSDFWDVDARSVFAEEKV
jgi:acetone carboxylase alpha subunit